ncbi:MAG: AAA family ATPase [bacterium]
MSDSPATPAKPRLAIDKITIKGYKSIKELVDFELGPITVLIGANGSGKSNLLSFFSFINEIGLLNLQAVVAQSGGRERYLHLGSSTTTAIEAEICLEADTYAIELTPVEGDRLLIKEETIALKDLKNLPSPMTFALNANESNVRRGIPQLEQHDKAVFFAPPEKFPLIEARQELWPRPYHITDTGFASPLRTSANIHGNRRLQSDGGNIAPMLYRLLKTQTDLYERILNLVKRVAPFIGDFDLRPNPLNGASILFQWFQSGWAQSLYASQLSDGTLRFICLITALLQPEPPSIIMLDEPELGLHPYAIHLLADLIHEVAVERQVIVATQSPMLLDHFNPEQVVVVEREEEASIFRRLTRDELAVWLEDYSLGEIWRKGVLGGRSG